VVALMTVTSLAQTNTYEQPPRQQTNRAPRESLTIDLPAESRNAGVTQDEAQGRTDLWLLTRAENRADALRAQLITVQMSELELQSRIEELDYQMEPESLQRALAFVGSARPMDELREALRKRLDSEKSRINEQLEILVTTQASLESAIRDADAECARLRERLNLPSGSD
jgi:hypothetical protein